MDNYILGIPTYGVIGSRMFGGFICISFKVIQAASDVD
jgi:hypothetical protein